MSIDATRWAWQQQGLRPIHKLVLLSLADRAGADDSSWPSHCQLSVDTGANRKTVWQALIALRSAGLIEDTGERRGRTGKVVVFRLVGVDHREKESLKRNSSKNGTIPFSPDNDSENGIDNDSENGIRNLPVEPTINRKRKNAASIEDLPQPEPALLTEGRWKDFYQHRLAMKRPLTEVAASNLIMQLRRAVANGWSADELIEQSIANGWQGVVFDRHMQPRPKERGLSAPDRVRRANRLAAIDRGEDPDEYDYDYDDGWPWRDSPKVIEGEVIE